MGAKRCPNVRSKPISVQLMDRHEQAWARPGIEIAQRPIPAPLEAALFVDTHPMHPPASWANTNLGHRSFHKPDAITCASPDLSLPRRRLFTRVQSFTHLAESTAIFTVLSSSIDPIVNSWSYTFFFCAYLIHHARLHLYCCCFLGSGLRRQHGQPFQNPCQWLPIHRGRCHYPDLGSHHQRTCVAAPANGCSDHS